MRSRDLRLGAAAVLAITLAAMFAPWLSGDPIVQHDPVHGANLAPGSRLDIHNPENGRVRQRFFLLGTDRVGRDVWARLVHGSRVSLIVALFAALAASLVGIAAGSIAVVGGRAADAIVMRLTDGFTAFPRLFLLLALAAFLESGPATVILVLGATSWMPVARLVRAELMRLRTSEMALAAQASGSSQLRILSVHLLPNALAPVLVATTLRLGDVLLLESALSFLGLGIRPPTPSWGNMIADGAPDIATAWWTSTLPGIAIVLTVVAFNVLGDGLHSRFQLPQQLMKSRRRPAISKS